MIVIIVQSSFKSLADRDRMLDALLIAGVPTRQEPGVIEYRIAIDPKDPLVLRGLEIYTDEEAILSHNSSEHMAKLLASVSGMQSEVSLRAFKGDLEPFDLGALIDQGELAGDSGMSFSMQ